MITLIWAQTKKNVIGNNNELPWKIKEEMKHFTNYTTGKSILMGRMTWESIPNKPLKNRENYVATKSKLDLSNYDKTFSVNNIDDLLSKYQNSDKELVVIGGLEIFKYSLPFANKLIQSIIYNNYEGNVLFNDINYDEFNLSSLVTYDEFEVREYERIK